MRGNVSLGPNGVDRVRSMRKIQTRLRGTNFCTSSGRFATSFVRQQNGPGCSQMIRNAWKRQFRAKWGGSGAFVVKNSNATSCTNFCTSSARFPPSFIRQPNDIKHTKTSVWGPMGWIGIVRCEKFRCDFVARAFAPVRHVLHRVS